MNLKIQHQLSLGLEAMELVIDENAMGRLIALINLLSKWNKAYNLTAIRDESMMVSHHLLDSLSILPFLHGAHILDVGTGAGFPGLPLAICCPQREFALVDSNGKKVRFVRAVKRELGLKNVEVVQARVEELDAQRRYSCILTRAFSSLQEIISLTGHLCSDTGRALAMKGRLPQQELEKNLGRFKVTNSVKLKVPSIQAERHLIIMEPQDDATVQELKICQEK